MGGFDENHDCGSFDRDYAFAFVADDGADALDLALVLVWRI